MSRRGRIALAAAALAAGAGCILLGRAVLGERASIARTDVSLGAPVPAAPVARSGGIAGAVLGTGDDRVARAAAADYGQARAQTALALAVRGRERAESELLPLATSGPAAQRSWASTLVAVLEVDASRVDRRAAQRHVRQGIAALQAAVGADPANEDAKRDLELLLTLQQQGKSKGKQHTKHSQSPKRGRAHGRTRAVASPPGSGW